MQGLGSHPYYTWVKKRTSAEKTKQRKRHLFKIPRRRRSDARVDELSDVVPTTRDTAEVMWLRDLLPSLIPNARIATYSYESDWRKASVKTSLRQCGEQLLNILHQNRSSETVSKSFYFVYRLPFLRIPIGASTTISIYWAQSWRFGHQTGWLILNTEIMFRLSSP